MSGHRTYILTNLKIQNYVSKIKLFSPYMDIQSSLEHVAVHFYLVLTAILGHLDSFVEKFYPDIVSLSGRRRWSQLHVLSRGQGISLKLDSSLTLTMTGVTVCCSTCSDWVSSEKSPSFANLVWCQAEIISWRNTSSWRGQALSSQCQHSTTSWKTNA